MTNAYIEDSWIRLIVKMDLSA